MAAHLTVFRKPFVNAGDEVGQQRQYLYFCTRKASKLSPKAPVVNVGDEVEQRYLAFLSCVLLDLLRVI